MIERLNPCEELKLEIHPNCIVNSNPVGEAMPSRNKIVVIQEGIHGLEIGMKGSWWLLEQAQSQVDDWSSRYVLHRK